MTEGPQFRVHPTLGVLVKTPGAQHWRWILAGGQVQVGFMDDALANGAGWTDPLEDLRNQLAEEISRRTTGGTPCPITHRWESVELEPPESAADPVVAGPSDGWKRSARPPLPST